jgi:Flp pilus assembly protein TadG
MRRRSHAGARSRGQALVEFALIAPLFFLLLFGIIEAGRFVFYYEILNNATREGARYAIVHSGPTLGRSTGPDTGTTTPPFSDDPTGEDVVQQVRQSATGIVGSAISVDRCWWNDVVVTPCDFGTHGSGGYSPGSTVTVRATYTYASLIPLVPLPNITVTAESSLVITN